VNPGTAIYAPPPLRGHVMPHYRLGDLQERQIESDERRQARALDYLISERQTARQESVQKMALEAAQKAATSAQDASFAITIAASESQRRLGWTLLLYGVAGLGLVAFLKSRKQAPPPKEAA
jgi:hypothetical protein